MVINSTINDKLLWITTDINSKPIHYLNRPYGGKVYPYWGLWSQVAPQR